MNVDGTTEHVLVEAARGETKVYTGHGDGTTVGTEAPHLEEWIKRGS